MYRRKGLGATASPGVQAIANAIAQAEGYFAPGSGGTQVNSSTVAPVRNNNPCDLTSGGSLASYADISTGWNACYNQINAMLNDTSSVYSSDMSLQDIGSHYAPAPSSSCGSMCAGNNPNQWAANVAAALGVSPTDTSIADIAAQLNGSSPPSTPDTSGLDLSSLDLSSVSSISPWAIAALAALGIGLVAWASG